MRRTAIVAAVRTPVGRIRGQMASVKAEDLAALVIAEAVRRGGIVPDTIDEVVYSNLYAHEISNMARYAALAAGLPNTVPGITVDRRCGSSLTAIQLADCMIRSGDADCVLAGGVEMDSRRPYVLLQQERLYSNTPPVFRGASRVAPPELAPEGMGMTAENLAIQYNISRQECDSFAAESHRKATAAWQEGRFDQQIIAVEVSSPNAKSCLVTRDEVVRPDCTVEGLSRLKPAFCDGGVSTAGNSSPMSDGASAVLLMEAEKAKAMGCEILGYIAGTASVGVDPAIMGIGPVYATRKLLQRTGLQLNDIDLIEMNEAFAAQSIACVRELDIDPQRLNVNGGAIALGHPLAATGGILIAKLVYEMRRIDAGRGLVTFCCGGGQGISLLVERD